MKIIQKRIINIDELSINLEGISQLNPDILLVFSSIDFLITPNFIDHLHVVLPRTAVIGCSTAGEITSDGVYENTCVLTGIRFDNTGLIQASTKLSGMADSFAAGERIGDQLISSEPRIILLYAPGIYINGSALIDGLSSIVGGNVKITGGLAGDNGAFKRTLTLGLAGVQDNMVVAIGLTGNALSISHGCCGGWIPIGPARKVTRCKNNILFE